MLRLRLRPGELAQMEVGAAPAVLPELADAVRAPRRRDPGRDAGPVRPEDAALLTALLADPCTPAFLQPTATDPAEAVDEICSVPREQVARDLADNVAAGFPPPPWLAELGGRGPAGTRMRRRLGHFLTRVLRTFDEHLAAAAASRAPRWAAGLGAVIDEEGPASAVERLGPWVRLRDGVLEVDLVSGSEVDADSTGGGILVMPTLASSASVTVSSTGARTVLFVPLPESPGLPASGGSSDALARLLGETRAVVLAEVANGPIRGVRALARALDLAPATASTHLRVLRDAGLVTVRAGALGASGHVVTPLGHRLLRGG
ncbi:ArsR/SmtB family transcription factor [Georgenia sp. Z1344]